MQEQPVPPSPTAFAPSTAAIVPTAKPKTHRLINIRQIALWSLVGCVIATISVYMWLAVFTQLFYLAHILPERIIHQQAVYSPQTFFLRILDNHPDLTKTSTEELIFDGTDLLRTLPLQKPMPWVTLLLIEDTPLESLPTNINLFTNVKQITIRNTRVTEVPTQIGDISTLEILNLEGNRISRLPESIGNLTNLTTLSLAYNKLEELPASMQYLTNLTELDLTGNRLREFPRVLPPNLKILYIGGNRIPVKELHKTTIPNGEDIFY